MSGKCVSEIYMVGVRQATYSAAVKEYLFIDDLLNVSSAVAADAWITPPDPALSALLPQLRQRHAVAETAMRDSLDALVREVAREKACREAMLQKHPGLQDAMDALRNRPIPPPPPPRD